VEEGEIRLLLSLKTKNRRRKTNRKSNEVTTQSGKKNSLQLKEEPRKQRKKWGSRKTEKRGSVGGEYRRPTQEGGRGVKEEELKHRKKRNKEEKN